MKLNRIAMTASLVLVLAIAAICAHHTQLSSHEVQYRAELAASQAEADHLQAEAYWARIAAMPKSYHRPLDQLWVSSGTGYRQDPLGGVDAEEKLHRGVDLAAPIGTPVYAVLAGTVMEHYVPPNGRQWKGHPIYGGYVAIDHGDELLSEYAHLSATYVHEGDWVEAGDKIGLVGDTGICTGPHLHIAIVISPLRYFAERK